MFTAICRWFAVLVCLFSSCLSAAPQLDVYTVASTSSPASALALVLNRLTGGQLDLKQPLIQEAFATPGDYLVAGTTTPLRLNAQALDALLLRVGAAHWVQPRPGLLFWIRDMAHSQLVSGDQTTPWADLFRAQGEYWALPTLLPLMDLDDVTLVTPDLVSQGLLAPVLKAGQRYGDYWPVLAELSSDGTERWQLRWQLYEADGKGSALIKGQASGSPQEVVNQTMAAIADYFAHRFATPVTAQSALASPGSQRDEQLGWSGNTLRLRVDGLRSLDDVLAVQSLLAKWPSVSRSSIENLAGDTAILVLEAKTDQAAVISDLQAESRLRGDSTAPFIRHWQNP